jgi:DNA-binding transcriptional MerR regulator
VEKSYKNLAPALKINYPGGKRKAKEITFSSFFAKAGISGYYGPFFNEVHINNTILPEEYPFVLAHEKAHQFGITSEAEANFYAWLACFGSSSKQLQYSANLQILRFFLYHGYSLKNYREIVSMLDENVKSDFRRIQEHWEQLRNEKVDKIANKVNDTYLKTNKIEKGIEDYTGVVKFVMDFSQDSVFQEKWNLNLN